MISREELVCLWFDYNDYSFIDYENTVKKYLMFSFMDKSVLTGEGEYDEDL